MSYFKCGEHTLKLGERTYVMGILNLTPDSFSDGGEFNTMDLALKRAIEIEKQGADILDVGAQSTRPGFNKISAEEEIKRLIPVLKRLKEVVSIPISVDTFYYNVAYEALKLGADIINDVTGFKDENMFRVVSGSDCGCVIMHDMEGLNIKSFFKKQSEKAFFYGIEKERLCFDPGIGFGKTYKENLYILGNVEKFKLDGIGMLVGASRKRVVGMPCGNPPFKDRTYATIAAHTLAISKGADIIRVHDVEEAVQAAKVADAILRERNETGA